MENENLTITITSDGSTINIVVDAPAVVTMGEYAETLFTATEEEAKRIANQHECPNPECNVRKTATQVAYALENIERQASERSQEQ